jgi:hypothetical protein
MARKQKTHPEIVVSAAAAPARNRRKPVVSSRPNRVVETPGTIEIGAETVASPVESAIADPAGVAASYQPSHQEIAKLAYSFWIARGCQGGSATEDWARAEAELCSLSSADAKRA